MAEQRCHSPGLTWPRAKRQAPRSTKIVLTTRRIQEPFQFAARPGPLDQSPDANARRSNHQNDYDAKVKFRRWCQSDATIGTQRVDADQVRPGGHRENHTDCLDDFYDNEWARFSGAALRGSVPYSDIQFIPNCIAQTWPVSRLPKHRMLIAVDR